MQQETCRKTNRSEKIITRTLPPDQKNLLYGGGYQQKIKSPEDHKIWEDATTILSKTTRNDKITKRILPPDQKEFLVLGWVSVIVYIT